ncbi:class II aldolase/adducin family protein [Persephonella sp.]
MRRELVREIIFTGKVLYREGLVNSHAGNISVRYRDSILITRTGSMLGYLTEDDIIEVSLSGEDPLDEVASSELIVHRAIYQETDTKAIIHAHPVNAVALSFLVGDSFTPVDNEGKLFLGTVPVLSVSHPSGSPELAEALSEHFKNNGEGVVLVKKHGSFVAHSTLNYALKLTSDLEFCSRVYLLLKRSGYEL